jgi:hypothetical protein
MNDNLSKRLVKIEIAVVASCETYCHDDCFWLLKGGLNCRLFDMNLEPHDNFRSRERCPDCLEKESSHEQ